jgi:hypothetical protein
MEAMHWREMLLLNGEAQMMKEIIQTGTSRLKDLLYFQVLRKIQVLLSDMLPPCMYKADMVFS